ncbi:MAG: hypothetical protein JXJ22_02045 [Bacteroidales bacterium]|nr:hypothetical protein [Bacteroidales bacterium]
MHKQKISKHLVRLSLLVIFASLFLFVISFKSNASNTIENGLYIGENIIRLNPDFKLKRYSNGIVEVYNLKETKADKYHFNDFNADVLLAIYRRQTTEQMIPVLARKYSISHEESRRKIKHSLNILSDWNIILRPEKLAIN